MAASLPYEGTVFPNSCNLFLESQSFKQSLRRDFCIYGTRKNRCYHPNAVPHCGFVCNFRSRKCRVSGDSSVRSWQEILFMGSRRIVGVFAYSEAGITSLFAEENGDDGLHNFEDAESKDYPMVRSYENDLCRLTLIGNRSFEEAITAAAADGGVTAAEHIASGRPLMVIETIYPGHCSEHSTVSTRLWPDDIKNCAGDGAWMGQDLTEWARLENKIQTTTVIADGSSSSTKEVEDMDESGGEDGLKRGVAPVGDILSQDRMGGTEKGSDTHDIAIYETKLCPDPAFAMALVSPQSR